MSNITNLIEESNKLSTDMQALLAGGKFTAESREKFDAMSNDLSALDADIARINAFNKNSEERSRVVNANGFKLNVTESNDPAERAEVRKQKDAQALRNFMKTGEQRDLTISGTSSVTIPTTLSGQVTEALKSFGEAYNLVKVLKTDHMNPMNFVLSNDTSNGWANVTVGTDVTDVDPTLSGVTINTDVISTNVIRVGIDLLNDSGFDVASWVYNELGTRYARGAAGAIINGGGPNGYVKSLLSAVNASSGALTTATNSGNVQYNDLAKLITSLDPAYQTNAVFAMNNATIGQIATLADNNGRPLWLPDFGSINGNFGTYTDGRFFGSILGRPVKLVTQLANAGTGVTNVLFGDFSYYTFREPTSGLSITRMSERYLPSYEVGFIGFSKNGGAYLAGNGVNPIVGLSH